MRKKQPKYASKRLQNVVQVRGFVLRLSRWPEHSSSVTLLQAWKDRSQSPRAAEQGKFEELADDDDVENGAAAAVAAAPKKRKRASKGE